jgi:hypothetical protein
MALESDCNHAMMITLVGLGIHSVHELQPRKQTKLRFGNCTIVVMCHCRSCTHDAACTQGVGRGVADVNVQLTCTIVGMCHCRSCMHDAACTQGVDRGVTLKRERLSISLTALELMIGYMLQCTEPKAVAVMLQVRDSLAPS